LEKKEYGDKQNKGKRGTRALGQHSTTHSKHKHTVAQQASAQKGKNGTNARSSIDAATARPSIVVASIANDVAASVLDVFATVVGPSGDWRI
jgi:hypothetical protein